MVLLAPKQLRTFAPYYNPIVIHKITMKKHLFFSKSFKQSGHSLFIKWAFSAVFLIFSQETKACGFNYVGSCGIFSKFLVNGLTSEYSHYSCDPIYKTPFPGTSGTSNAFGSNITEFKLTDVHTTTWESCTNHVIKSAILYRIFDNPTNKGSFIRLDLDQQSSAFDGVYTSIIYEKPSSSSLLANLLTGLQSYTNYTIEMYFEVEITSNEMEYPTHSATKAKYNNTINDNVNTGEYYSATFQTGHIGAVLPVAFLNFQAQAKNQNVFLNWQTATEKDNKGFQIERSVEGKVFENIGEVKGSGTSNEKQTYTFTDTDPLSIIGYYRLCQVDNAGNKTYSKTIAVSLEPKNNLTLFPNPAKDHITLQLDKAVDATITVFDMMGRMVLQTKNINNTMDLDISNFQAGTYWARVMTPKESMQRVFVKQ